MQLNMEVRNMVEAKHIEQLVFHNKNKHRFKIKRNCSCCKAPINENDVMFIGESKILVWFNHKVCNSTMTQKISNSRLKAPIAA